MRIVITGSASGIGFATGLYLLKKGHTVVFTVHTKKELENIKEKGKKFHLKNTEYYKLDITDDGDRKKIIEFDADCLIQNAAIGIGGSLLELSLDNLRKNFEVNLFSALQLSRLFIADLFVKKKKGKVIFISSLAANFPISYIGSYCMTKASMKMMVKVLKKELKQIHSMVQVKVIEPGIYNTGFNEVMFNYIKKESISLKKKKFFRFIGSNNLNTISKTISNSVMDNSNKLIYRSSILESILVKLYHVFFS